MKTLYLYSNKRSVLEYWKKHIAPVYNLVAFSSLGGLFEAFEREMPDVILFDYDGKPETAREVLHYVEGKANVPAVMAMNGHPLFEDGMMLLREGARAFMNTYAAPANLNRALEAVLGGNIWLYPEFIQMMIKHSVLSRENGGKVLRRLSAREREIAQMVALGMSNKEIASSAKITEQTVKSHLKTIYEKLGVSTRLELAILLNKAA